MKTSQSGLLALTFFEGERLTAYQDPAGIWTIGVGHTAAAGPPAPKAGMTLTKDEVQALLAKDIVQYENEVQAHLTAIKAPIPSQNAWDGMVSFCYNLGGGNFDKAAWVASWAVGNMVAAEAQLKQWDKVRVNGQLVTSVGLARRRDEEADMIFRDRYPNGIPSTETASAPVPAPAPAPPPILPLPATAVKPDPTSEQASHQDLLNWIKSLIEGMFPGITSWLAKL